MSSPQVPQVVAPRGAPPGQSSDGPDETIPARRPSSIARTFSRGFLAKILLLAVVDALGVYVVMAAWAQESFGILWAMVALLVVANWAYFTRRAIPLKYILPGVAFLLVYQVFVVAYTGYVAFTNYGDGHNSTKEHAIEALLAQNEKRVEGTEAYTLAVVEGAPGLGFALVNDGEVRVGWADEPLADVPDAVVEDGVITEVPGWTVLPRAAVLERQQEVVDLRVPVSDDAEDGSIRTQDARNGYVYRSTFTYDEEADRLIDTSNGLEYAPNDEGNFEAADGTTLPVGWRVTVGMDNFVQAFGDTRYSTPFFKVLAWTVVFAVLSVVLTFLVGMFFAVVLNDDRIRFRRVLRALLILPYAFPAFMSYLLWRGMLNRDFGVINTVLLGGADINWLADPWLAKIAVLVVQVWVGFPYMFLICTGALQSIPGDLVEAAKIDGAGRLRMWRSITLPLVLVATAPLLISSFAFNFNNFNIIEMITEGNPRFADASVPVGATDILITMVYSVSGLDGGAAKNYGLASALSIVIFIIVATISVISFRRTRTLEELS
ncbi:ABC transporter permease subunit [Actinotalea ferrariae]|uniref:ABC transporter permease subunit n=1 Tax=Actinotalea ferrariae TaxID=1386098 RepID=UPI001C8BA2E9|nr:ABC transporter permease subunit [Actinotalea ferrariae]MBX9243278.1 ABC transporter permease subunit [Actinotalea ferrariae]